MTFILVDDSRIDLLVHQRVLEKSELALQKIIVFQDPREALAFLLSDQVPAGPLVILLDIQMPFMSGFMFMEEYDKVLPEVRQRSHVVLLSSSSNDQDKEQAALFPEIKAFLNKPLEIDQIVELLAKSERR